MSLISEMTWAQLKRVKDNIYSKRYYRKHRQEITTRRKAKTVYICSCGQAYMGRGSWLTARKHAKATKHRLTQNGRRVRWPRLQKKRSHGVLKERRNN